MRKMLISAALVLGTSSLIAPATAQPVVTGGLVNVTITDPAILNNLGIQAQVPVYRPGPRQRRSECLWRERRGSRRRRQRC